MRPSLHPTTPTSPSSARRNAAARQGFTLVEIIIAATITMVGIASAAVTLQMGLNNLDTARTTTVATQILQDHAESMRLLNWNELNALPGTTEFEAPAHLDSTGSISDRIRFRRAITDVNGKSGIKQIALTADWSSLKNVPVQRTLVIHYAKGGVFDYYYGTTN